MANTHSRISSMEQHNEALALRYTWLKDGVARAHKALQVLDGKSWVPSNVQVLVTKALEGLDGHGKEFSDVQNSWSNLSTAKATAVAQLKASDTQLMETQTELGKALASAAVDGQKVTMLTSIGRALLSTVRAMAPVDEGETCEATGWAYAAVRRATSVGQMTPLEKDCMEAVFSKQEDFEWTVDEYEAELAGRFPMYQGPAGAGLVVKPEVTLVPYLATFAPDMKDKTVVQAAVGQMVDDFIRTMSEVLNVGGVDVGSPEEVKVMLVGVWMTEKVGGSALFGQERFDD